MQTPMPMASGMERKSNPVAEMNKPPANCRYAPMPMNAAKTIQSPWLRGRNTRRRIVENQPARHCGFGAGGSGMSRIARTMLIWLMRHDENVTVRKVSTTPSE